MIAALQMYDWPEIAASTDAFWARVAAGLAAEGIAAPAALARPANLAEAWTDPALLLGQSCGLPYVSGRCGGAVPVARPVYAAEGCGPGTYCSALICRAGEEGPLDSFRGRRVAINEIGSQSGCHALADAVLPLGDAFFAEVVLTGGHRASAGAVARGEADLAAIDAVAWALLGEVDPATRARLSVIGWTAEMPALPFITAGAHAGRASAVFRALAGAARPDAATGLPVGVLPAADSDYDPIRAMAARVCGLRLAPGAPALGAR